MLYHVAYERQTYAFLGMTVVESADQNLHRCLTTKYEKQWVELDFRVGRRLYRLYGSRDMASE